MAMVRVFTGRRAALRWMSATHGDEGGYVVIVGNDKPDFDFNTIHEKAKELSVAMGINVEEAARAIREALVTIDDLGT